MGQPKRVRELEITEDIEFQRRSWAVQRAGWVILGAIVLLGLTGLLGGSGPLSRVHAGGEGAAMQVQYDRFERVLSPSALQVILGPQSVLEGQVRLKIPYAYLDKIEIRDIEPQPQSMSTASDGFVYTFAVEDPTQPGRVYLYFDPQQIGRLSGDFDLVGGESLQVSQFVFP